MKKSNVIIRCKGGLHLRVAAQIVMEVQQRQSKVHLRCEGCPWANACSIFELLKLGASHGTPLEVVVDGTDEDATLEALTAVLDREKESG